MKKTRPNSKRLAKTALLLLSIMAFSITGTAEAKDGVDERIKDTPSIKSEARVKLQELQKIRSTKLEQIASLDEEMKRTQETNSTGRKLANKKKEVAKKQLRDAASHKLEQAFQSVVVASDELNETLTQKQIILDRLPENNPGMRDLHIQFQKSARAVHTSNAALLETELQITKAIESARPEDSKNAAQSLRDTLVQFNKARSSVDALSKVLPRH